LGDLPLRLPVGVEPRPPVPHVLARPVRQLADGRLGSVHDVGHLMMRQAEDLAQHEHRPLYRRKGLEDDQQRHRHRLSHLDLLCDVRRGEQRLG